MHFKIDFEKNKCNVDIVYRKKDFSFVYYPYIDADVAILLNYLEINIDSKCGEVRGVSGFHAYTMWQEKKLFVPIAFHGALILQGNCCPGMITRIKDNLPTFYDPYSKWLCIGDPEDGNCASVKFANNAIASIKDGNLVSLWIQPVFQ